MVSRTPRRGARISGTRIQSGPYPPSNRLSRFGTVQWPTDGKLDALSSLRLFTVSAFFPSGYPEGVRPPAVGVATPGSRRQRALPEPVERFTDWLAAVVLVPRGFRAF